MMISVLISMGLMAQDVDSQFPQDEKTDMPQRAKRLTYEQMTEKMVKELTLDEKQAKKVTKLNKKYKTLIEGERLRVGEFGSGIQMERPQGQRPPMGQGQRPDMNGGRPNGGGGMPGGGMGGRGQ